VQTAYDLEPLLADMDGNTAISTQTLVSGQQQKAAKVPQYGAALAGNVGRNNFAEIDLMV